VTWTVITSILFVTTLVLAIVFYSGKSKAEADLATARTQYGDVVRSLTAGEVGPLKEDRTREAERFGGGKDPLLDVAVKQRDALAALITGSPEGTRVAEVAARAAAAEALSEATQKRLSGLVPPVSVDQSNLVGSLTTLTQRAISDNDEKKRLSDELAAAKKNYEASLAAQQQKLDEANKAVAAAQAAAEAARGELAKATEAKEPSFVSLNEQYTELQSTAQKSAEEAQGQIRQLNEKIKQQQAEIARLQAKLAAFRAPTGQLARAGDGRIVRNVGNNTVFINLGSGDQISPGMTFEVYDRVTGVPAATVTNANAEEPDTIARGKASIEVVRVQPGSSEARVIRTTTGQVVTDGDVISNLVYDKNTKYNFVVHGKFDLDRNNVVTAQDAEVVKRLITQWGGRVADAISVDTDFVILGKEPEVPSTDKKTLEDDPLERARYEAAVAELDAYNKIRDRAIELNVPILNQNRFLYFVGYYELSAR
jgi:hypothetical protein